MEPMKVGIIHGVLSCPTKGRFVRFRRRGDGDQEFGVTFRASYLDFLAKAFFPDRQSERSSTVLAFNIPALWHKVLSETGSSNSLITYILLFVKLFVISQ
jgi:hypothetical protein